jgi:hypothetical protein
MADGALVTGLLAGLERGGAALADPYRKFSGSHWRLVSLADLRFPAGDARLEPALDTELAWAMTRGTPARPVRGLHRNHASQEGNAVAAACRLGFGDDRRVPELVDRLAGWQWPDGGWNCDTRPEATHSSFNESLWPLLGLARYADETHDGDAKAAARGAAEFFLRHRVVFAERTGELAHPTVEQIHYPPYWHFDLLAGLRVLASIGHARDERAADALDLLERKRRPDGAWQVGGRWWRPPGSAGSNVEVVDWGGRGPSEPATLAALRILKAAGRWPDPSVIA